MLVGLRDIRADITYVYSFRCVDLRTDLHRCSLKCVSLMSAVFRGPSYGPPEMLVKLGRLLRRPPEIFVAFR